MTRFRRTIGSLVLVLALVVGGLLGVAPASPVTAGAGGGGACHDDLNMGPSEGEGTVVELAKACMNPTVLRVPVGAEVTFVNRDPMLHNLVGSGMAVPELHPEESAIFRFGAPATFPFACTLHFGMVGAVIVGDGRSTGPRAGVPSSVSTTTTTTTTAAPVRLAATGSVGSDSTGSDSGGGPGGGGVVVALGALGLVAVIAAAGAGFVAGGRRRSNGRAESHG